MSLFADTRRTVSFTVVLVLLAGFVWAASAAEGYVTPEPDLHDAGVWVSRADQRRVGRTNTEIMTVDASLAIASDEFDLHQSGANVLVRQHAPSTLFAVDPATAEVVPGPEVPATAVLDVDGGTAALADADTGTVHVVPADQVLGLDLEDEELLATTVDGPMAVVVDGAGHVHVADVDAGEVRSYDRDRNPLTTTVLDLDDVEDVVALTVVGGVPAVLDAAASTLHLPEVGPVDVGAAGDALVVQRPSDGGAVHVQGTTGWLAVATDTGEVTEVAMVDDGPPAVPVVVDGCAYAAWSGSGTVGRQCADGEVQLRAFPALAGGRLQWRVNRGRVLLNELETGTQLVYGDAEPVLIDDWSQALTDEVQESEEVEESVEVEQTVALDRSTNEPPVAADDDVGTRAGRPVLVRPLRNDVDPDGDVLVVSPLAGLDPDLGTAQVVDDGRGVLVEVAAGVDRVSFPYEITDGNDHADTARITVTVADETRNTAPEPGLDERTTVVTGGTVLHDVVAGALDREGDPVSLVGATTEAGTVVVEASGQLAFTATNAPGEVEVLYTLADDRGAESTGRLVVTVVPREINEPPSARDDVESTVVGREVVVDVLANDDDANGDELAIVRVEPLRGGAALWEPTSPEVRVRADAPGTYVFLYRVTDGADVDEAYLRVDVAPGTEQTVPVAVRDDVRLAPGVPAFVPVLDNDSDPDGDVLVVTGVQVPSGAPVDVQVVRRSLLRVSTDVALREVVEVEYRITDGGNEAIGTLVVAPAPERDRNQPPVARPDEFTVRAGGVALLPVLANDEDPDGEVVTLVAPPEVDDATAARDGRLFLSGGELRYEAPDQPRSTIELASTIQDTGENVASAQLLVHVVPADGEENTAPRAPTLVARAVAGGSVVVPVPISTMDPDGDAVQLLGIGEPPRAGAVVETTADTLVYRADERSSGTDQFTYRVRDAFGLEATGRVLVGVAPRSTSNNDPVAVDDAVQIRPGGSAIVPVLDNDRDPDGDVVRLSTEADDEVVAEIGEATVADGLLTYRAPSDADVGTVTSFRYVITDGLGGRDDGTVTIEFVDEVENRAPQAVDDLVEPQEPGTTFSTLPLQANDLDADGDDLTVVSVSRDEAVIGPDGSVTLTMTERAMTFTYVVSDGELTSRGVAVVPVAGALPPIPGLDEAQVRAGDEVRVPVLDNDVDPEGAELVLLDVLGVRHGDARIDGDEVVFVASEQGYTGDAGLAYLVGDGPDPASARTAVGVVQVQVLPPDSANPLDDEFVNTPPAFTSLQVDVPLGASRTLELRGAVTDPDDEQQVVIRDLAGGAPGIDARLVGDTLTVEASLDAEQGTTVPLTVVVDDGIDQVQGEIAVSVIASDKPLPTAVADTAETIQGQPVEIDVLANDVNPFPGEPLRLLAATSPAGADVAVQGDRLVLTPDPARRDLGELSFEYTLGDVTEDPLREVTGTVRVTVVGRPDIPAAPSCIGGESGQVQITWAAPNANGARITEYRVRVTASQPGGPQVSQVVRTYPGGATVQTVDGLTNGLEHRFEVAAINEAVVGDPEFSAPSAICVPDQVPDRPTAPVSEFGDQQLRLTFAAPPVDGSPVTELVLNNTTTGEEVRLGASATEYVWQGLENGTAYRFTLTAVNARGASDPSELSTGDPIPAGVPQNPVAPTTEKGDQFLTARWSQPQQNGAAIEAYRITVERAGVVDRTQTFNDPATLSAAFDTDNGVNYRFRMEARNKAGWSQPSPWSPVAVSAGRPFAISSVSASEGDRASMLSFTAPNDNGAAITRYEYSANGGGWQTLASNRQVTGLSNGSNYSFRVRAVNSEGASDPSPTSNTINPWGKTNPVRNLGGQVTANEKAWYWDLPTSNGRPTQQQWRPAGGSWTTHRWTSGCCGRDRYEFYSGSDHRPLTIEMRAFADGASSSDSRYYSDIRSTTFRLDTTPTVSKSSTSAQGQPGCSSSACRYVRVNVTGLVRGETYTYRLRAVGGPDPGDFGFSFTLTADNSGNYSGDSTAYYGYTSGCVELYQLAPVNSSLGTPDTTVSNCANW